MSDLGLGFIAPAVLDTERERSGTSYDERA
jgi:hypothetical protein